MPVDEKTFLSLSRRTDRSMGISERFVQPVIGGRRTVAVISEPFERSRPIGLVLCHSFALEQIYLARFDVQAARALSAAGFPVLRYHGQGYGDSEGIDDVGLSSHISDATDAVGYLVQQTGVPAVGLLGARLGATVAAIVADRLGADLLAAVAPATDGRRYMRQLLWSHVISDWTARGREDLSSAQTERTEHMDDVNGSEGTTLQAIRQALNDRGSADIGGFRLSARSCGEIEAMQLAEEVRSFVGDALILGLSRSGKPRPDALGFARHLEGLGARVTTDGVPDPLPDAFGRYNFRTGPGMKVDRLTELSPAIVARLTAWFTTRAPS